METGTNSEVISIEKFVLSLWIRFFDNQNNTTELLEYGHKKGWLEDQDERFSTEPLNKRTAARILHQFMKLELKLPDLDDLHPAEKLKDLYTCHACVNHVAQVYLRNLMDEEEIEINGETACIFNMLKTLSQKDTTIIIEKLYLLSCN